MPGFGGLRVDLSSTAMVGLAEGARYLVEYPYGCAEQRSSRALGLMLAADLGEAFNLPGIDAGEARSGPCRRTLNELQKFQCGDGGFAFWPGDCYVRRRRTSRATSLHVFQRGKKLGYTVDQAMLDARVHVPRDDARPSRRRRMKAGVPRTTRGRRSRSRCSPRAGATPTATSSASTAIATACRCSASRISLDALQAKGETGARVDRSAPPHRELDPARGRTRVRQRAERSVSAVVLELERPLDRDRAGHARARRSGRRDRQAHGALADEGAEERALGQHAGERVGAWSRSSTTTASTRTKCRTSSATVALGNGDAEHDAVQGPLDRGEDAAVLDAAVAREGPGGTAAPGRLHARGHGHAVLHDAAALRVERHAPRARSTAASRSSAAYALQDSDDGATSFKAGDLIEVTLRIRNTKERRYVAVTDPIPAGTEPVEAWFATTATRARRDAERVDAAAAGRGGSAAAGITSSATTTA